MEYEFEPPPESVAPLPDARLPPQNLEAEQCVLGSMLLDRECIGEVLLILGADDFYVPAHGMLFEVLQKLYDDGKPVDLVLATNTLKEAGRLEQVGGVPLLVQLMECVPSAAHAEAYAQLVSEAAQKRRLVTASHEILKDCWSPGVSAAQLLDTAEQKVFAIAHDRKEDAGGEMTDLVRKALERIDQMQEGVEVTRGIKSHYTDLDKLLNGLAPGALYIIAGRPSMGKSSFATSLLDNVCVRGGLPAMLFTLEVTKEQVAENMLCSNARVDAHKLVRGQLDNEEYARVPAAAGRLSNSKLFIDDTPGLSLTRLRAKARRVAARMESEGTPLALIVVDYLQLLTLGAPAESRQIEISRLSGGLKQLARELKLPVISLSQLNRGVEQRQDKRPLMGDLRESGSIEQDADAIMLVFREEYYFPDRVDQKGKGEIIVAKNRNGPTGVVELNFHANMMRFDNPYAFPDSAPPPPPPPGESSGSVAPML